MTEILGVAVPRPRNKILARLPLSEYQALAKHMVPIDLPLGMDLSSPQQAIDYSYFPVSGLVSTDILGRNGESVEVGVTGREGLTGIAGLLGQPQLSHSVLMQGAGKGLRIRMTNLREEFLRGGMLQQIVYDFIYLQIAQMTQSILCNRMHQVEARLARWLLTSADRMESSELQLTQEFLAQMLGSRRSTVTVAAGSLQRAGMIDYRRGKIRVVDRTLLEKASCECYLTVRSLYDRVIPQNL